MAVLNVVILYQPFTRFSPLHEGDTSVAPLPGRPQRGRPGFSPLHEGDTSVASVACCSAMSCNSSFSPLHEGDTSVAVAQPRQIPRDVRFQSPSRGGHLRGEVYDFMDSEGFHVSVPFTRGTPPWRGQEGFAPVERVVFQSPSRGGHLRGLLPRASADSGSPCFSPLHEGDTSVAVEFQILYDGGQLVSVPFTRGTPPWPEHPAGGGRRSSAFQSPSRGGHLRGNLRIHRRLPGYWFQSPSRGGHLRGLRLHPDFGFAYFGFSPLHEGDTSVAAWAPRATQPNVQVSVPFTRGTPPWHHRARPHDRLHQQFQSPSRGGHLRGHAIPCAFLGRLEMFQSPSRGGHLRGLC